MNNVMKWINAHRFGFGVTYITTLVLALAAISFLWINHNQAAQAAKDRAQGIAVQHRICLTLDRLAARRPPSNTSHDHPSRQYLIWLHDTLSELGPDIGCPHG